MLPAFQESDIVIANFTVDGSAKAKLKSLLPASSARRELKRFFTRAVLTARLLTGGTVSQSQLFRDLEGKNVALVGNARSLGASSYGQQIDLHDVVIRFNRVPILSRKSHGYKTDWVATGVPLNQARLSSLGASRLLWLSAYRRKMTAETAAIKGLYVHPHGDFHGLTGNAHVERPSTGFVAIDLLRRSPCRAVSLYGFDFYQSRSSSSHQTIDTAPHQFNREEIYVQQLLERDARFTLIR